MQRAIIGGGVIFLALLCIGWSLSQVRERPKAKALQYFTRYGQDANVRLFPQKTPKEAMESIVHVLADERFDYLMAQLADPDYVDAKVAGYKRDFTAGNEDAKAILAFERLVAEATKNFYRDPELIRELRRFAREGDFDVKGDEAIGVVKGLIGRQVILRRLEERWFLKNRPDKGPEPPPEK